ncbi:MAG: hypothetical protein ABFD90_10275 [Phycisphaerales bacterium]
MPLFDSPLVSHSLEKISETHARSAEFAKESGCAEEIVKFVGLYQWISQQFPHTHKSQFSGHFFPWVECYEEMRVSCTLCLMGFYKQAMVSLRASLELGILSVYWNLDDMGHETIQAWLRSETDTPWRKEIWERLNSHKNFRLLQEKYDIGQEFRELSGVLDDYVHSKGAKHCNAVGVRTGHKEFEPLGFRTWYTALERVTKLIMILHLTKYPIGVVKYDWHKKFGVDIPMFGGLEPHAVDALMDLIGEDVFTILQSIAEADEDTQRIMQWVQNRPEMTDEDIENQVVKFAKLEIQAGGGFKTGLAPWLRMRESLYDQVKENLSTEQKEHEHRVLDRIMQWARECGYDLAQGEREMFVEAYGKLKKKRKSRKKRT